MGIARGNSFGDVLESGWETKNITINGTAQVVKVGSDNLEGRQELIIYNKGNSTIYIGKSNVTTSGTNEGYPIESQETGRFPFGASINLYAVSDASTTALVWELG